ncbi:WG repeat-containing protein [Vallitalea okinawensis]|uniref:WG repeat-containing protein n=1 Tax=Vallitalea okinawensis TaxID=2078660 RepID=UPI001478A6F7|nr:WG repeat-containing protein [Vallitalea okinawensis]
MRRIISMLILVTLILGTIPVYADSIENFVGDYAIFEKDGKYGIVDKDGNITVEPEWEAVYFKSLELATMKGSKGLGLLEVATGRVIIQPKWNSIMGFITEKWIPITDGTYIYIYDITTGKQVSSSEFPLGAYVMPAYAIPYVRMEDGSKIYTLSGGKTITLESNYVLEGFANGVGTIVVNDKYGLIDITSNVIVEPQWDYIDDIIDGIALAKKDDKTFVIDITGKVLFESQWDYIGDFHEGIAVISKDGKYGLIDSTGKIISEPQWDQIDRNYMAYEMPSIVRKGDYYGYINTMTGEVIIDQLDYARDFSDGIGVALKDDKKFYIDMNGQVPFESPWVGGSFEKGVSTVITDDGVGFIDITGKVISEPQWDGTYGFYEGLAAVRYGEKWGYMDWYEWREANPNSIPPGAPSPGEPIQVLEVEGKWGFIDMNGNLITEIEYDDVENFHNGRAIVIKDGIWGFIDTTGKLIFQLSK